MIAYLCDSCGLPLSGNNGDSIVLSVKSKIDKLYTVKVIPDLEHYHKNCVVDDLKRDYTGIAMIGEPVLTKIEVDTPNFKFFDGGLPSSSQKFPLGEWKTSTDIKVDLRNYNRMSNAYLGRLDAEHRTLGDDGYCHFDGDGDSHISQVGKLMKRRRSEEERW